MICLTPIEFHTRNVTWPAQDAPLSNTICNHLDSLHGAGHWIDLWYLPLHVNNLPQQAMEKLRPDEVRRANRMRLANARERFILDHAWRNHVLGLYVGGSAADVLAASRLGKERLLGRAAPGVSFSRTGSHAVAAISDLADIGVDIEDSHPSRRWLPLAQTIDGHGWPAGCEREAERARWTCRQFVVKEALLKGVGIGLRFPLRAIEMHYSARPIELYQKRATRAHHRPRIWRVISEMRRLYSLAVAIKFPQSCNSLIINEFHSRGGESCAPLDIFSKRLSLGGEAG